MVQLPFHPVPRRVIRFDASWHGHMGVTWYRFTSDGLYYPALVGMFGDMKLVCFMLQDGALPGFATWQEACDYAQAAQLRADGLLCNIEDVVAHGWDLVRRGQGVATTWNAKRWKSVARSRTQEGVA